MKIALPTLKSPWVTGPGWSYTPSSSVMNVFCYYKLKQTNKQKKNECLNRKVQIPNGAPEVHLWECQRPWVPAADLCGLPVTLKSAPSLAPQGPLTWPQPGHSACLTLGGPELSRMKDCEDTDSCRKMPKPCYFSG